MAGLTEELARFVADQTFTPTAKAESIARFGLIDAVGVMLCGQTDDVVRIATNYVRSRGAFVIDESTVLFTGQRASSEAAALINGTACHVLDYDDVGLRAHPSAMLVPAILAEAERRNCSGREVLRAYIVGYEVWAELNAREPGSLHSKGWHPTAAVGVVAVAAAIASLARLCPQQARHALAISASMAAGLISNFGSMTKSFQVGRASASGIEAVKLAEAGMTGSLDAIEHPAGFLAALSPDRQADLSDPEPLGKNLRIVETGLSFKKYPMCYCTHRVIDAAIDLATMVDLKTSDIDSIDVRIGTTQHTILRNARPHTALEAKFSIEFAIAASLTSRSVGLAEVQTDYVNRPDIQKLIETVRVEEDPSVCPIEPAHSLNDRLVVKLKDGRVLDSGDIRFPRGHARLPLTPAELKTKFLDCLRDVPDIEANVLFNKLSSIETLNEIRLLTQH